MTQCGALSAEDHQVLCHEISNTMSKFEMIIVGKQFAFRLALIAFVVIALRGLIAGDDFFGTIQVALFCLGLFFVFGYFLGDLARRLVEEHAEAEATVLLNGLVQASHNSASTPQFPTP